MRRFLFLILILLTVLLFFIEGSDRIGLTNYKPAIEITNLEDTYRLTWSPISYFAYYEVEIVNQIQEKEHLIIKYRTFENSITINQNFPESAYLRVSAHSLFHHPLGSYSDFTPITTTDTNQEDAVHNKPHSLIDYPIHAPASNFPLLMWTPLPGAVYYEIELLNSPPENPNDILPSHFQILSSREVFTNGYSINLTSYPNDHFYWRVRALDYTGNPVGVFSDAVEVRIDHTLRPNLKPLSNTGYKTGNIPVPLYPVYSWIPIAGATSYEFELTSAPPENPNGVQPSRHRLRQQIISIGSDYYDETPLSTPGTYYWRVRGLDESGAAVGVYSNAESFVVDRSLGNYAATLGDSITHGGGAVSYSPADIEYSFQNYLSFPTMNLGRSGDTSASMLSRFEADVLPYHPMFLIIMGGTNSLRGGVPGSQVIKELSAIRDKCLVHGIRPIFLTLPPINPQAIQQVFNEDTVPEWKKEFAVVNHFIRQQRYYIDLEPYFADGNQTLPLRYATDGLHLDIEGKKLMAQIINANWAAVTQ